MASKRFLLSSAALIALASAALPAHAQNDLDALLGELTYGDSQSPAKEFAQEALTLPETTSRQLIQTNQQATGDALQAVDNGLDRLNTIPELPNPTPARNPAPIEAGPFERSMADAPPAAQNAAPLPSSVPSVQNNNFALPPSMSSQPLTKDNVNVPSPITQVPAYSPPAALAPTPLPQSHQTMTNHGSMQQNGGSACATGNCGSASCDSGRCASGGCASGNCGAPRYAQRPPQPWLCEPHRRPNLPGPKTFMQEFHASNCQANVWEGYHQEVKARCERCHNHLHGRCDCYAKEMAKRQKLQKASCSDRGCSDGQCQQRGCTNCN